MCVLWSIPCSSSINNFADWSGKFLLFNREAWNYFTDFDLETCFWFLLITCYQFVFLSLKIIHDKRVVSTKSCQPLDIIIFMAQQERAAKFDMYVHMRKQSQNSVQYLLCHYIYYERFIFWYLLLRVKVHQISVLGLSQQAWSNYNCSRYYQDQGQNSI